MAIQTSEARAGLRPDVVSFLDRVGPMLIDGTWVESIDGGTLDSVDPRSGQVIAAVSAGGAQDVDRAVVAARRALTSPAWARTTGEQRGRLLWKLADALEAHAEEFAQLEAIDQGKPQLAALGVDVPLAAGQFRFMAGLADKIEGKTVEATVPYAPDARYHTYTRREPVGVAGLIIPWNFPLNMAAWKLAPSLAAGCTVVLKPAEQTPLSALRLAELIVEVGFPPGVVNVVPGLGETAGAALAAHPDVDKIAFTGSTEVGRKLTEAAGGNLKKLSLELGGKSPNIVFADADIDAAVAGAAAGIFFNKGEVCSAGSRVYVERSVHADVVRGLSDIAVSMPVGDPLHEATAIGPLVSKEQLDRVTAMVDAGVREGASAARSPLDGAGPGYYYPPTVLFDVRQDMAVVREEIFGPVVVVLPFDDESELVALANDSDYGLAAGIWTKDIARAHRVAGLIEAGTVWINCYNAFSAGLPFGGYKQSGWGREQGAEAMDLYLETKTVCVQL
ncbi:aldehyde dehydrogenase family protein [Streptomyces sp. NPDC055078]